jgi:hypothetical protein
MLVAGLILTGCQTSPQEVQYVKRSNSTERLTLIRERTAKAKLISTFHDVFVGSYSFKTTSGTISGTFTGDGNGFNFRSEEGKSETVKFDADGSFEYANATWVPRTPLDGKVLRVVLAPRELKAQ